ncbi:MAG: hypothetical protein ACLFQF_00580 [Rhodosalinus sp.]
MPGADAAALEGLDRIGAEVPSDGILHLAMRSWPGAFQPDAPGP